MESKIHYNNYTDFMSDSYFVLWMLFPTDESTAYWSEFTKNNPQLENIFVEAQIHFLEIKIEKDDLSDNEKQMLLERIKVYHSSTNIKTFKLKPRYITFFSIASVFALLIISFLIYFNNGNSSGTIIEDDFIIGDILNSSEIQLITGDSLLTLKNDVQLQIDIKGEATIIDENEEEKIFDIRKSTLNKLVVPYGKQSRLTLADGSKVWLNSGSVLDFPTQFTGKSRDIFLKSGEMYIEVSKNNNKPFYVHASGFDVHVYGTIFNVSSYTDSSPSVVLIEGSISLKTENKKEMFLKPNEQALLTANGELQKQVVDASQYISWKNGYLVFEETLLIDVLKQVSRYYNLSFKYDDNIALYKRTCSGNIYLSDNFDNVMKTLAVLSSTKYVKEQNKIYFYNETK